MIGNKFTVDYEIKKSNISSFFDDGRITVPAKVRKAWVNDEGIGEYLLNVDSALLNSQSFDDEVKQILNDIDQSKNCVEIKYNPGKGISYNLQTGDYKYYNYNLYLSDYIRDKLSALFISTFVRKCDAEEGICLEFDAVKKTVTLKNIHIDNLDDPFYLFARKAAAQTSFKAILPRSNNQKINFYEYQQSTEWKDLNNLEKMREDKTEIKNVVYMLFDANDNLFYVGKADKLVKRLTDHQKASTDRMRNFTHFRYTPVTDRFSSLIYLIENTAIHDCAAIFNMPNGKRYKAIDLETHVVHGHINPQIILTNSDETQTK